MSEETTRTDRYKIVLKPCECENDEQPDTRYTVKDGKLHCSKCDKEIEIIEFILYGCAKCDKPKFKEIDKIEKELYGGK
jgi:hypothetical protein